MFLKKHITKIKFITFIFGSLTIIIYGIIYFLKNTFGYVEFQQIIWNLEQNNRGIDSVFFIIGARYIAVCLLAIIFLYFVSYKHDRFFEKIFGKITGKKISNIFIVLLLVTSICYIIGGANRFSYKTHFYSYFMDKYFPKEITYDFIKENYYVPSSDEVKINNKKNLVIVLIESHEQTYFDKSIEEPLNLKLHSDQALSIKHFETASNMNWTISAVNAWHFGMPLKLPFSNVNDYFCSRGFLPKAHSIFSILKDHGYQNYLVIGTDKKFSNQDSLFTIHGEFKIYDKNYWISKGFSLSKYSGTGMGYNDRFTLERAREIYSELISKNEPFVLFIQMIDGHTPRGWAPKNYAKYDDVRDSINYMEDELANFVKFIDLNKNKTTALALIGDHLFMGEPRFIKKAKERHVFNQFYLNDDSKQFRVNVDKKNATNEMMVAIDVAPTLLELAGAKWKNHQFGLGHSIFSNEKSLINKYGKEKFSELIRERSPFYEKFY